MITIIDYDAGNLRSVENALQFLGEEAKITRDPQEILKADKVILPGVGAFGDAMEKLTEYNNEHPGNPLKHEDGEYKGQPVTMP